MKRTGSDIGSFYAISPNHFCLKRYAQTFESKGISVQKATDLQNLLDSSIDSPSFILEISQGESKEAMYNLINTLHATFDNLTIILTIWNGRHFTPQDISFLDADYAFHLPEDENEFFDFMTDRSEGGKSAKQLHLSDLEKVYFPDLEIIEELPFEVYLYLPKNKKVLSYRKKGDEVNKEAMEKFTGNLSSSLFIHKSDRQVFHRFVTGRLKSLGYEQNSSPEERARLLREESNRIFKGFLTLEGDSPNQCQLILENLRRVAKTYLGEISSHKEAYDQMVALTGQVLANNTHAINVSAYCVIFGNLLEIHDVENLAFGGLVHDIGMALLDPDINYKPVEYLTSDELRDFQNHPLLGINYLSEKGFELSFEVEAMIAQHHETGEGNGFPKRLLAEEIHSYAKICAFANEFDKLTSHSKKYEFLPPMQAIKKIAGIGEAAPSPIFDPDFHPALVNILLKAAE